MRRINKKIALLIFLLFTVMTFILYDNLSLAKNSNEDESTEANAILDKIEETNLTNQIEEELKKNGYTSYTGFAYQIYSSDKQYLTIIMKNIEEKNKNIKNDIQKIVDEVSKENDLNLFIVDIQEVEK